MGAARRGALGVLTITACILLAAALTATSYLVVGRRVLPVAAHRIQGRPVPGLADRDVQAISAAERAARGAAIRALLGRRSAALLAHDQAAFLAGIDPRSPSFRLRQARLFANLRAVPLGDWSYTVDPARELPQSPSRLARFHAPLWVPFVDVRYRIAGYDVRPTEQRQFFTFVLRAGRWYIGADDDFEDAGGQTARGLWDFGPVIVTRTPTTIVLGHPGSRETMRVIAAACEAAVPRVSSVWGHDWPGRLVVLVPDTQAELSRIIQEGNDLSQIAAVATADLAGTGGGPVGERIIVNPPNFRKLGSLGRRVVLQHEITHVASRAVTTGATPTWLAEGFADYVGYLDSGVPVQVAARELAVDIRAGRAPKTLPSDADFAGTNPRLAQAYEEAWLANRLIAATVGQRGLVRFYRVVGSSGGASVAAALDSALRSQLHMSTAQFTARWRGYVAAALR